VTGCCLRRRFCFAVVLPELIGSDQGIENRQQFAHGGGEGQFFWFALGDQPGVEPLDGRVVTRGDEGHHVEDAAEATSSAPHGSFAGSFSRVVVKRSHADELGNLLAIEFAQLGKFGDERADGNRANAFDGAENFDFSLVGFVAGNGLFDLLINRFELRFEAFQDSLDRMANVAITRLLQPIFLLIDQIDQLPAAFDECAEFGLLVGLGGLRCGAIPIPLAKSRT
jgi:hypothetical protein